MGDYYNDDSYVFIVFLILILLLLGSYNKY